MATGGEGTTHSGVEESAEWAAGGLAAVRKSHGSGTTGDYTEATHVDQMRLVVAHPMEQPWRTLMASCARSNITTLT